MFNICSNNSNVISPGSSGQEICQTRYHLQRTITNSSASLFRLWSNKIYPQYPSEPIIEPSPINHTKPFQEFFKEKLEPSTKNSFSVSKNESIHSTIDNVSFTMSFMFSYLPLHLIILI